MTGDGLKAGTYEIHPMAHLSMIYRLDAEANKFEKDFATNKVLKVLAEILPPGKYEDRAKWRAYFPHVSILLSRGLHNCLDVATICLNTSMYHGLNGRYAETRCLAKRSADIRKKLLGKEHTSTLMSISNLAEIFYFQEQFGMSLTLETRVSDVRKRTLGEKHPDTLASMSHLALVYTTSAINKWNESIELGEKVLNTRRELYDAQHQDTLESMQNLALTYLDTCQYGRAEKMLSDALKTCKKVLGKEHPDILSTMSNLAIAYHQQRRLKEAKR